MTGDCHGIFAIVSMPYSGSTILSFLLGSRPDVYNGADLHHLNPDRRGQCSLHRTACKTLDQDALERIYAAYGDPDQWYDTIASVTGKPHICDASKQLTFFRDALAKTSLPKTLILLRKHPMRSVASDVHNRLFAKQLKLDTLEKMRDHLDSHFDQVLGFIAKRLVAFIEHYEEREKLVSLLQEKSPDVAIVRMAYEELVQYPEKYLTRILDTRGLKFELDQLDYTVHEHHPITGNLGPLWKVRTAGRKPKGTTLEFRKGYYMREPRTLFLDDKYKHMFSTGQMARISALPEYRKLVEVLDYSSLPE